MIFRSEEEQLIGHELIKDLRNLKLSTVPPMSPSSRHETLSNNEAFVVHLKGNQSYDRQQRLKIKSRKWSFKLVCDMLTKKWVIFKKDRPVRGLMEVASLLEALGMPLKSVVCRSSREDVYLHILFSFVSLFRISHVPFPWAWWCPRLGPDSSARLVYCNPRFYLLLFYLNEWQRSCLISKKKTRRSGKADMSRMNKCWFQ
jgi:hypothetical protein